MPLIRAQQQIFHGLSSLLLTMHILQTQPVESYIVTLAAKTGAVGPMVRFPDWATPTIPESNAAKTSLMDGTSLPDLDEGTVKTMSTIIVVIIVLSIATPILIIVSVVVCFLCGVLCFNRATSAPTKGAVIRTPQKVQGQQFQQHPLQQSQPQSNYQQQQPQPQQPAGSPSHQPGGYPSQQPAGSPSHQPGRYPSQQPGGYPSQQPGGYPSPPQGPPPTATGPYPK